MKDDEKPDPTAKWEPSKLPDAGAGRFWRIERNPKNQTKPVRISLMQQMSGTNHPRFATLVGYGQSAGIPELVYVEAQLVLDIHGRVEELVGEYGIDD